MESMILVTGGTGYIGSHTVVELLQKNYNVVIVDNLSNSEISVLENIEKITGKRPIFECFDLCEREKVDSFFQKYRNIEAIIHFAAYKAVGESTELPLKYYQNNLLSLINLLNAMLANQIFQLVFSSSCTVYGQPEMLPVTENAPIQRASSPYGNTKQICEEIIQDAINANSMLKCISLRYFNPIGAHFSAKIGELPRGVPNNLIPFITQTSLGVRESLKVFGDDYQTPDGSCIRDYIHVVDLAKAHIIALERMKNARNKNSYEYFNVGTGKGTSVFEIIETFEKVTKQTLNYKVVGRRAGDIEKIWADTSFANQELGWKTELSLEEALLSAWNWEKFYRKL